MRRSRSAPSGGRAPPQALKDENMQNTDIDKWAYWVNREVLSRGFVTKVGLRTIAVPPRLAKGPEWDESRRQEIRSWKLNKIPKVVKIK